VPFARVKRLRRGGFQLRLPVQERDVLATLPEMLRSLLSEGGAGDPAMERLFPRAFLDDEAAAAEFDAVVRDDLLQQRLEAVDTMERTLRSERLSEDELVAWLAAVNDLRLVLGVRLAVTEESSPSDFEGDPEAERAFGLYAYLSYLEEDVVRALSSR
jgi:hypothetical protein